MSNVAEKRLVTWLAAFSTIAAICLARTVSVASGLLDVGGSRIFYEVAGMGPTIVLIHDGHMHSESWNGQWESLSKDHRVIRYDRRGYGKSTPAGAPYSN